MDPKKYMHTSGIIGISINNRFVLMISKMEVNLKNLEEMDI